MAMLSTFPTSPTTAAQQQDLTTGKNPVMSDQSLHVLMHHTVLCQHIQ